MKIGITVNKVELELKQNRVKIPWNLDQTSFNKVTTRLYDMGAKSVKWQQGLLDNSAPWGSACVANLIVN